VPLYLSTKLVRLFTPVPDLLRDPPWRIDGEFGLLAVLVLRDIPGEMGLLVVLVCFVITTSCTVSYYQNRFGRIIPLEVYFSIHGVWRSVARYQSICQLQGYADSHI
jgi:hypothetical protein